MNRDEERAYWARVVIETQKLSGLKLDPLAEKIGICVRELVYLKAGKKRPTGLCAVKLYEYRALLFLELESKQA